MARARVGWAARTAVLLLAPLGVLLPTPASADAPAVQGWWTVTNPGALPTAPPSDVPRDGLLVQSGRGAPTAYAALSYVLAPGAAASRLTLPVAAGGVTLPGSGLALCVLAEPDFEAAQGAPLSEAPAYDCGRTVSGAFDAEEGAFAFDVATLVSPGGLAVAVLPVGPSRVVLSRPDEESLATRPGVGSSGTTPGSPGGQSAAPGAGGTGEGPSFDTGSGVLPPMSAGALALPPVLGAEPAVVAAPEVPVGQEPEAEPQTAQTFISAADGPAALQGSGVGRLLALLLLAGAAVTTTLWAFVGGSPPAQGPGAAAV